MKRRGCWLLQSEQQSKIWHDRLLLLSDSQQEKSVIRQVAETFLHHVPTRWLVLSFMHLRAHPRPCLQEPGRDPQTSWEGRSHPTALGQKRQPFDGQAWSSLVCCFSLLRVTVARGQADSFGHGRFKRPKVVVQIEDTRRQPYRSSLAKFRFRPVPFVHPARVNMTAELSRNWQDL